MTDAGELPEEARLEEAGGGDVFADNQTSYSYLPPETGLWVQMAGPPSRTKEVLCSLPFYLVVMAIPTAGAWVLAAKAQSSIITWIAIGTTVCAVVLCILRAVRGNLIDAEKEVAAKLVEGTRVVNNRLAKQLWDDEIVKWETRRHPISIIPTVVKRLVATKWRRGFTFGYLVALAVTWHANMWAGLGVALIGVGAVAFTIME